MIDEFRAAFQELIDASVATDPERFPPAVQRVYHLASQVPPEERELALEALGPFLGGGHTAPGITADLAVVAGALVEMGAGAGPAGAEIVRLLRSIGQGAAVFLYAWERTGGGRPPDPDQVTAAAEERVAAELGETAPTATVCWWTVNRYGLAAKTMLSQAEVRSAVRADAELRAELVAIANQLSGVLPEFGEIRALLRMAEATSALVLERASGRGFRVLFDGIGDNFHLHTLLADALVGAEGRGLPGERPDPRWIAAFRNAPPDPEARVVRGWWNLTSLDGSWVRNEGVPADIPTVDGEHVLVLEQQPYSRSWNAGRRHPQVRGWLEVEEEVSAEEAAAWWHRAAPPPTGATARAAVPEAPEIAADRRPEAAHAPPQDAEPAEQPGGAADEWPYAAAGLTDAQGPPGSSGPASDDSGRVNDALSDGRDGAQAAAAHESASPWSHRPGFGEPGEDNGGPSAGAAQWPYAAETAAAESPRTAEPALDGIAQAAPGDAAAWQLSSERDPDSAGSWSHRPGFGEPGEDNGRSSAAADEWPYAPASDDSGRPDARRDAAASPSPDPSGGEEPPAAAAARQETGAPTGVPADRDGAAAQEPDAPPGTDDGAADDVPSYPETEPPRAAAEERSATAASAASEPGGPSPGVAGSAAGAHHETPSAAEPGLPPAPVLSDAHERSSAEAEAFPGDAERPERGPSAPGALGQQHGPADAESVPSAAVSEEVGTPDPHRPGAGAAHSGPHEPSQASHPAPDEGRSPASPAAAPAAANGAQTASARPAASRPGGAGEVSAPTTVIPAVSDWPGNGRGAVSEPEPEPEPGERPGSGADHGEPDARGNPGRESAGAPDGSAGEAPESVPQRNFQATEFGGAETDTDTDAEGEGEHSASPDAAEEQEATPPGSSRLPPLPKGVSDNSAWGPTWL